MCGNEDLGDRARLAIHMPASPQPKENTIKQERQRACDQRVLCLSLFLWTGWNDVPKQSSTRSTSKKRRTEPRPARPMQGGEPCNTSCSVSEMPKDCSELARMLVLASWPAIVQGLIAKAIAGNYQQTKLLLDMCALPDAGRSNFNEEHKRQLCDALLEGLTFTRDATGTDSTGPEGTPSGD